MELREDAWGGKPGTNWKQVGPGERKKLAPLVRHYMKKPHPFTSCVRDNTKRFGQERAERICAVVKDLGHRSTKWRGKKKDLKEAAFASEVEAAIDALLEAAEAAGPDDVDALVEYLDAQAQADRRASDPNAREGLVEARGLRSAAKRLPNGEFAPAGRGQVLAPGSRAASGDRRGRPRPNPADFASADAYRKAVDASGHKDLSVADARARNERRQKMKDMSDAELERLDRDDEPDRAAVERELLRRGKAPKRYAKKAG